MNDATLLAVICWLMVAVGLAVAALGVLRRRRRTRRYLAVVAERRAEAAELRRQDALAAAFADMVAGRPILPLDAYGPDTVVVSFLPRRYEALLVEAVPNARTPLAGSRGIGEQRGRIAALELDELLP